MTRNLIYFGSPQFSAEILETVINSDIAKVVGVVSTPDKPQGRKQLLTPSPVSLVGDKYNLPVYKPTKLDNDNLAHLKLLKPDIFLVVSYGKIIPANWLTTPHIGTFNIHFSLLPKYRGALCITEAIKNQDPITGITLMVMDEKMDHGPVVSQASVAIDVEDDQTTLTKKLTQAAVEILRQRLPEICAQNYPSTPQDDSLATFTPSHRTITRDSAYIPSPVLLAGTKGQDASVVHALIRSLTPEPGAWTKIGNTEIKLLKTSLKNNTLIINIVQIPGKHPISWPQFLSGHPID